MPEARCIGEQAVELAASGEAAALGYVATLCAGCPVVERPAAVSASSAEIVTPPRTVDELVGRIRQYTFASTEIAGRVNRINPGDMPDRIARDIDLRPYIDRLGASEVNKAVARLARRVIAIDLQAPDQPTPNDVIDAAVIRVLDDAITLADQKVDRPVIQASYRTPEQVAAIRKLFENDEIVTGRDVATCFRLFTRDPLARLTRLKTNYLSWQNKYAGLLLHSPTRFKDTCMYGSEDDIQTWFNSQSPPPFSGRRNGGALYFMRSRLDTADMIGGFISPAARRYFVELLESQPGHAVLKAQLSGRKGAHSDLYDTAINGIMRMANALNTDEHNIYLDLPLVMGIAASYFKDVAQFADMGISRPTLYASKLSATQLEKIMARYGEVTVISHGSGQERPLLTRSDMIRLLNQRHNPAGVEQIFAGFGSRIELGTRLFGDVLGDRQIRNAAIELSDTQGFIAALIKATIGTIGVDRREEILGLLARINKAQEMFADPGLNPDLIALVVATEQDPVAKIRQLIDEHVYGDFSDGATPEPLAETTSQATPSTSGTAHPHNTVGEVKAVVSTAVADLETLDATADDAANRLQQIAGSLLELMGAEHPAGAQIQRALESSVGHLRTKAELIRAARRYLTSYTDNV